MLSILFFIVYIIRQSYASDSCCETGIVGTWNEQSICCANSCGICGGDQCDTDIGGEANCCTDIILLSGSFCDRKNPPCIITSNCTFIVTNTSDHETSAESQELDAIFPQNAINNGAHLRIEVTACDGWEYAASSNALQIQLKTEYGSSPFFFVNTDGSLPTHGRTQIYAAHMHYMDDIYGTLFSIVLCADDHYGYCLKRIVIHSDDDYYGFEYAHFGMGLILSNKCKYTYTSLSKHRTLIRCIDDYLELYTHRNRGIYKLNMHTCMNKHSGISAIHMKNNVYTVIMGKRHGTNVYDTTQFEYMDHYAVGEVQLNTLGHLIATNILLSDDSEYSDPLYTRDIVGEMIGIKLECADYTMNHEYIPPSVHDKIMIQIDGKRKHFHTCSVMHMGKYLVAFLSSSDRMYIKPATEIVIYGDFGHHLYVNVYVIFDGFTQEYQLPFIIQGYNHKADIYTNSSYDGYTDVYGIHWFDANKQCMDVYGTYLISIHSKDENVLIHGFIGDQDAAWIGLVDFDINDEYSNDHYVSDWKWSDRSSVDYTEWRMAMSESQHKHGNDCAFMDGKYGEWSLGDCDERNKEIFVCASPYWYPNQQRKFEINVEDYIDEIVIVSIGNDDEEDALCIDSISVEHQVPIDMTNHWIGGGTPDYSLRAIFSAPICKTEVIQMKVLYDTATSLWVPTAKYIPGYECENSARLSKNGVKCIVNWFYAFGTAIKFRLASRGIRNKHVSWASASDVTLSTDQIQSISTTNELQFDKLFPINHVTNGANGTYEINTIKRLELRRGSVFYDIYEKEDEEDDDDDDDDDDDEEDEDEDDIDFKEQMWEHTPFVDLQKCIGSSDVPPSHVLPHQIWIGGVFIQVNVKVDLKLTLCPEFLNTKLEYQDSNIIYLSNVSAQVHSLQGDGCTIMWGIPQYINNTGSCADELQLAISVNHDYMPLCNSNDTTLYDGCQCNRGDTDQLGVCWCVDQNGNKIGGKAMHVDDTTTWQKTCRVHLNCSNTEVTIP